MILCLLINEEELCVTEINKQIPLNASPLSQHLKVMREEGLLVTRKVSQVVYYRIADQRIKQLIGQIKTIYCE
ncbi:ArsR/SmtB family transcription factor [Neisseria sp. Ec49-e6-T10]|uniref:ArsR/SmtB family transcription factor n=1 Tax=Neisseria sp. Ec49-e6-T10 TaxID=3140744 RepID=UPI003EBE7145